jgi:NADH dehydrogenase FAD-containing subunit
VSLILTKNIGWAGYDFARYLDHSKYHAVIVSPRSYFVFTPLLASTAVGTLEFRTAVEPVRSYRTKADFYQGWADSVDFVNKKISVEEAVDDPLLGLAMTGDRNDPSAKLSSKRPHMKGKLFDLSYDKLIIAVGTYCQTFNIPGVREHACFLKDIGDARKIRKRILGCFEMAALPTATKEVKSTVLNFAVVGGGPTGIEFAAELHDFIKEDLSRFYPDLMEFCQVSVYDVASTVLPMFDKNLSDYAMKTFAREGVHIKTSRTIQEIRKGPPESQKSGWDTSDQKGCFTMKVKEEGEIGVGMVVWSTGLMMNPFVTDALGRPQKLSTETIMDTEQDSNIVKKQNWIVEKQHKSNAIVTDSHLRLKLKGEDGKTETVLKVCGESTRRTN